MPKKRPAKKPRTIKGVVKKRQQAQRSSVARSAKTGTRLLQTPRRFWYKPWTWRHRPPVPVRKPLPKARILFWRVCVQLWQHKKLFGGIVLIYGVLNLLLVRGLSSGTDLSSVKTSLDSIARGVSGEVFTTVVSFTYLLASSGGGETADAGVYQTMLLVICSLSFIWALRQTIAKHTVRIRESFYQGMYPLVPFILVLLLLAVQLIPLAMGGSIYSVVINNGIAVHTWEKAFWLLFFVVLAWWSLRMITATIFALYIVTLPDMTPLKAYRSARQLVYGRQLQIWRKLLFLPVVLLLIAAAVEVPLILFATPLAEWTFFLLSLAGLPVMHAYVYNLYRDML